MLSHSILKSKGYSLVELTIALSITAIVALLAVPSATQGMLQIGVENTASQIVALSGFARTEALRRGYNVVLCGAAVNGPKNLTGCIGNTNWSSGLLVYQDLNLAGGYDNANERIRFISFESGISVISNQANISFSSNDTNAVSAVTVCVGKSYPGLGKYFSQQISINNYTASVTCTKTTNATCLGC